MQPGEILVDKRPISMIDVSMCKTYICNSQFIYKTGFNVCTVQ